MSTAPHVAVVILNWNGRAYLEQFLPSLLQTSYENMELIIADNASTDESLSFLATHYPTIRVIRLEQNYGFAKGYNEALKKVEADYYVLLNSDVEVSVGWLEPMVRLLESNPTAAACQPKLLAYHDKTRFEYAGAAGGWIDRFGYPFCRGRIFEHCETDNGQYNQESRIFWASGAALFIRARVFHEMRGFDEYFFAHQEEIDLCWRIQLAGYTVYSCPSSVVYHVGGGTLPRGNSRKTYLNFRNNLIMLAKNLPTGQKPFIIPFRMALDAITAWKGLLSGDAGHFMAIVRGHVHFMGWLFGTKTSNRFPVIKTGKPAGYWKGSIVWQHFIRKKNTFLEIVDETH